MKNLSTTTGKGRGKTKDQDSDSLVINLNTFYPCGKGLSSLIIVSYQAVR